MERKGISDFLILAGIVVILISGSILFSALDDISFSGSIKKFDSCTALASAFSESQNAYGGWRGGVFDSAVPMAAGEESQTATKGGYSETNVQVEGVDEADIVKTDGEYIYTVSGQYGTWYYDYEKGSEPEGPKLFITKAYPATDMEVVGEIEFTDFNPQEMFIESDMLMVFGYTTQEMPYPEPIVVREISGKVADPPTPPDFDEESDFGEGGSDGDDETDDMVAPPEPPGDGEGSDVVERMIYTYHTTMMTVKLFDISDRSNPTEVRNLDFEGNYLSSRKIGNIVYFIVNSYPRYDILETSEEIVPLYRDSNEGEEFEHACGCGDVIHFEPIDAQQFVTVVAMSISDPSAEVSRDVIVGSGQNIYMSLENLYIAETDYPNFVPGVLTGVSTGQAVETEMVDDTSSGTGEDDEPADDPDSEDVEEDDDRSIQPQEEREVNTNVHKLSLDGMAISYVGYMNVPGTVLNQFSMDEHEGYFRIATTRQPMWWGGGNQTNNVYIFDSNLQRTGAVEDLAPGESIYSARFMGDRGYLVTFKKIDPFFVIDLSDPANPRVLGKLKIPGYSDYLHPYDENHIIGIGKDTIPAEEDWGRDFVWYQGVKIAIFDVTDVENPVEMDKVVIGDRGTDSEALRTHKAFLFDREKNLLVIPILLAELTEEQKEGESWQYGDYVWQGAYVYDISLENGLELRGTITHVDDTDAFLKSGYYFYSDRSITRSLYINHLLYTISDTMIKANVLEDLSEEAKVSF